MKNMKNVSNEEFRRIFEELGTAVRLLLDELGGTPSAVFAISSELQRLSFGLLCEVAGSKGHAKRIAKAMLNGAS